MVCTHKAPGGGGTTAPPPSTNNPPPPQAVNPADPGPAPVNPADPGPAPVNPADPGPAPVNPADPGPQPVNPADPGPQPPAAGRAPVGGTNNLTPAPAAGTTPIVPPPPQTTAAAGPPPTTGPQNRASLPGQQQAMSTSEACFALQNLRGGVEVHVLTVCVLPVYVVPAGPPVTATAVTAFTLRVAPTCQPGVPGVPPAGTMQPVTGGSIKIGKSLVVWRACVCYVHSSPSCCSTNLLTFSMAMFAGRCTSYGPVGPIPQDTRPATCRKNAEAARVLSAGKCFSRM